MGSRCVRMFGALILAALFAARGHRAHEATRWPQLACRAEEVEPVPGAGVWGTPGEITGSRVISGHEGGRDAD